MAISFKKIKEVAEKSKETHLIDLGKIIDTSLDGVVIPIKVKSIEEVLIAKNTFVMKKGELNIELLPFTRMSKKFQKEYKESEKYKSGITENNYFQVCRVDKDETELELRKYRERLFNILIHFDMDYKTEENASLWEDSGLKKGDYNGLIEMFSDIIRFEIHLDVLDLVIDHIKNGVVDENMLSAYAFDFKMKKAISDIEDKEEQQKALDEYKIFLENIKDNAEKIVEENKKLEKKNKLDKKVETQDE